MPPKSTASPPNPSGLCKCGCGNTTGIAKQTIARYGVVKGEHLNYIPGHQRRKWQPTPPNPSGMCQCGCGQPAPIAAQTDIGRNSVKGHPVRFCVGHGPKKPLFIDEEDRGYSTPCWITNRVAGGGGYRSVMVNGGRMVFHRRMYESVHGPIPAGLVLDHLCRQRDCCNPNHLEPVSSAVNSQRGVAAKLTPDDIRSIRAIGHTQPLRQTAERFGISRATVCRILRRNSWANID